MSKTFLEVVQSGDFLVLDTETTGLNSSAEICQIAIVSSTGEILLDTYVKPTQPIPAEASAIHGISDVMVKDAPRFADIYEALMNILYWRDVVIYNADFDVRLLHQSAANNQMSFNPLVSGWHCAMQAYAAHYGSWDDFHGSYTWQKLTTACKQNDLLVGEAHTALVDAQMTLALINAVWRRREQP